MKSDNLWNIFIPQQLLDEAPGYLFGCTDKCNELIYISGIIHDETDLCTESRIGFWYGSDSKITHKPEPKGCRTWVSLSTDHKTTNCFLTVNMQSESTVCVVFNPFTFMKSYVMFRPVSISLHAEKDVELVRKTCDAHNSDSLKHNLRSSSSDAKTSCSPMFTRQDFLPLLKQMLLKDRPYGVPASQNMKLFYTANTRSRHDKKKRKQIPWFIIWTLSFIEKIVLSCVNCLKFCCLPFPRILHVPSIFQYLQEKSSKWKRCFNMEREETFNNFLLYNCIGQQLVDTMLGLLIIVFVFREGIHNIAATAVLDWADSVASQLSNLIQWLMGAPAGLKLNAQLTKFLGHFFIYHIYLWTGYVSLLRGLMSSLLTYCLLFGVLGVSAQICLLRDLLSMLTLHIYCFYVYAAKIFSLQVYMLGSLWRLFRGKKWNVLRSRVDSATYSTDQLFVGTLFFTVLLFLLPTTALYYAVFTLLRLATLTVQGCLAFILKFITATPVFTLVLNSFTPSFVAGNVKFFVQSVSQDSNCLVLNMQPCPMPLGDLLKLTQPLMNPTKKQWHSWSELIHHLATGKLIYPWVEPHQAS